MTHEIDVEAEARQALAERGDEERALLIERTAKAIFRGKHDPNVSPEEAYVWASLWNDATPEQRIRCRNQARAALAASELLERIERLEKAIRSARSDLECYGSGPEGDRLARRDALLHLKEIE